MSTASHPPPPARALHRLYLRGRRSLRLAWRAAGQGVIEFYRSDNLTYASSIAYYTLLSLFPFIWLVATLLSRLVDREQSLLPIVEAALPRDLAFLTNQVEALAEAPFQFGIISTLLTFWAAMGVFGAITSAVNHAWGVEDPLGFFKHKLVAFVTMLAAGTMLVATLAYMSAVNVIRATWFAGVVAQYPVLQRISGFAYENATLPVFVVAVGLIYYYVPNAKVRLRDVWAGALLTGVLWRVALWGFGLAVRNPERLMQLHGQIYTVILFLGWVYLSAVILLYGAEVTAAYARLRKHLPHAAPAAPVRES